jgi:hypothetical protein
MADAHFSGGVGHQRSTDKAPPPGPARCRPQPVPGARRCQIGRPGRTHRPLPGRHRRGHRLPVLARRRTRSHGESSPGDDKHRNGNCPTDGERLDDREQLAEHPGRHERDHSSAGTDNDEHSEPPGPIKPVGAALSYRVKASSLDARTVKVTTTATGRPEPGQTYWFMLEINWGDGNTDYYPRRRLDDQAKTFNISIPTDARTDVVRTGRVYALDAAQSSDAEARLARQTSTASEDDFFAEPTGRVVSNGERLPF